jgi:hypothetical protein
MEEGKEDRRILEKLKLISQPGQSSHFYIEIVNIELAQIPKAMPMSAATMKAGLLLST